MVNPPYTGEDAFLLALSVGLYSRAGERFSVLALKRCVGRTSGERTGPRTHLQTIPERLGFLGYREAVSFNHFGKVVIKGRLGSPEGTRTPDPVVNTDVARALVTRP